MFKKAMDDIIDAAQVMFEEDGISQETVNELRSVSLNLLRATPSRIVLEFAGDDFGFQLHLYSFCIKSTSVVLLYRHLGLSFAW